MGLSYGSRVNKMDGATYESWIDVGTEGRAPFLTVGATPAAYIKWHDDAVTFLEDLESYVDIGLAVA
jgi:hypothetical protein